MSEYVLRIITALRAIVPSKVEGRISRSITGKPEVMALAGRDHMKIGIPNPARKPVTRFAKAAHNPIISEKYSNLFW